MNPCRDEQLGVSVCGRKGHRTTCDTTHGKGAHNRAVADWLGVRRLWLHAESVQLATDAGPLSISARCSAEWDALHARQPRIPR